MRAAVSAAAGVKAQKNGRAPMQHRLTKPRHNRELLMRFRVRSKGTGMVWIRVAEQSRGKTAAVNRLERRGARIGTGQERILLTSWSMPPSWGQCSSCGRDAMRLSNGRRTWAVKRMSFFFGGGGRRGRGASRSDCFELDRLDSFGTTRN